VTSSSDSKENTPTVSNPQPKNHHEVLGIEVGANAEEIRRAYRELVKKYHPDRVTHLGEEFRTLAEQRMKAINTAYAALESQL
jgi:curved DNA-binding protein CbpA